MKKESGVTLIALVVTIIILMILATISISMLTGKNGLIQNSKASKEHAEISEEMKVINLAAVDAINGQRYGKLLTVEQFSTELDNYIGIKDIDYTIELLESTKKFRVTYLNSGRSYLVDQDGEVVMDGDGEEEKPSIIFTYNPEHLTKENVIVTLTTSSNQYIIEYQTEKKGKMNETEEWKVYEEPIQLERNQKIMVNLVDKQKGTILDSPEVGEITWIDKLAPNDIEVEITSKTSNSISLNANTTDAEATSDYSCSGIAGYKFSIDGQEWSELNEDGKYTFDRLSHNTEYTLYIKAIDKVGNEKTRTIKERTDKIVDLIIGENINFIQEPEGWTNQNVKVTAIVTENQYKLQTSKDNSNWNETNPLTFEKNGTMFARLSDGHNVSNTVQYDVTNIDKVEPKDFIPTVTSTTNSITVNGSTSDVEKTETNGCSGIRRYEYSINDGAWQESNVFNNLKQNTTYQIRMKAIDNAGNERITNAVNKATIEVPTLNGKVTFGYNPTGWTNGNVLVTITPNVSGYTLQYSTDGNTWSNCTGQVTMTQNGAIHARLKDSTGQIGGYGTGNVTNIDKVEPKDFIPTATSTTNSITVSGSTSDVEKTETNGCSGIRRYEYSINNGAWQESNVFNNLKQNTTYQIRMKAIDNAGNERITNAISKSTIEVPTLNGKVTFGYNPTKWTNDKVLVTITPNVSGYTLQYSTDGNTWNNYAGPVTMTQNGAIHARLKDSTGQIGGYGTGNVSNIDKIPPTKPTINLNGYTSGTWTTGNVIITASSTDSQSGVSYYQYSHDGVNVAEKMPNNPWTINWDGQWNLYVRAVDNAGNAGPWSDKFVVKRDATPPEAFTAFQVCVERTETSCKLKMNGTTTDACSGIAKYQYRLNSGAWIDGREDHEAIRNPNGITMELRAIDNAGNVTVATTKRKGWFGTVSGGYKYYDNSGNQVTGYFSETHNSRVNKYYLNSDGWMHTGWKQNSSGQWEFYITSSEQDNNGIMKYDAIDKLYKKDYERGAKYEETDWLYILDVNGDCDIESNWHWYYFKNGIMQTGWLNLNNEWYYLKSNGKMCALEWLKDNNKWYYFKSNGKMCKNENFEVNGKVYNFDSTGACTNP